MNYNSTMLIALIVIGTVLILLGCVTLYAIIAYNTRSGERHVTPVNKIDHSKHVLDFIQTAVSLQAKLQFDEFRDAHDMTKITKSNIQQLVGQVATRVKNSIVESALDLDDTVFTPQFCSEYIVDTSAYAIKRLLEKSILDMTMNEGE